MDFHRHRAGDAGAHRARHRGGRFALLPTRVSMFDLAATRDVVALCQEHKKPLRFRAQRHRPEVVKGIKSAVAVLKKLGPSFPRAFASALSMRPRSPPGRQEPERDKAAADEIEALWAPSKSSRRRKRGQMTASANPATMTWRPRLHGRHHSSIAARVPAPAASATCARPTPRNIIRATKATGCSSIAR